MSEQRALSWRAVSLLVASVALTLLSFVLTRAFDSGRSVGAQSVDQSAPAWVERGELWYVPLLDAEQAAPKFDGAINSIKLAPDVQPSPGDCRPGAASFVTASEARSAPVDFFTSYLPSGTTLDVEEFVSCGEQIVSATRIYTVPADPVTGRFGGSLLINRSIGASEVALDAATTRVRGTELEGRPAVVVRPLTDDGFGPSAAILREPWGTSRVEAWGLSETELLKIVSGLYQNGAAE